MTKLLHIKFLRLVLLTCYLCSYTVAAQAVTEKLSKGPEYNQYYDRLKELELKQLNTGAYKKYLKLHKEFVDKMFYTGDLAKVANNYLPWIMDNIEKTSFGSFERAEMEWNTVKAAHAAIVTASREYQLYVQDCSNKCDSKIFDEVLSEVMRENPELFW